MIRFQCDCGKAFNVPDEQAGKRGKCSACGNMMRIPGGPPLAKPIASPAPAAPARKPASPAPAASSPPRARAVSHEEDEPNFSHLYDLDEPASPGASTARGPACPNCTNPLPSPDSVFCVECGYNLKTRKLSTFDESKPDKPRRKKRKSSSGIDFSSRLTSSKVAGGALSLVGGSAWLIAGLTINRIYFYPFFLIIGGLVGIITGLISGDD